MIVVVAELTASSEHRAAVLEAVRDMRATTLVEPGCHKYDFFESAFAPGRFAFVEEWEDADALRVHSRTAQMANFQERIAGKVTDSRISIHEVASTRVR